MSRLNIDDSLIGDERFVFVCNKIGRYQAMGQFVFLAKLAQKYWLKTQLIPWDIFALGGFSEFFFEAGLLEKRDEGIYLKGSEDYFAWLIAQRENGKKGGRPRKNNSLEEPEKTHGFSDESHENLLTPININIKKTKKEKESKKEKEKNETLVTQHDIITLWDKHVSGVGVVRKFPAYFLPQKTLDNFLITSGFPEFRNLEQWENYFKKISSCEPVLNGEWCVDLSWAVIHDNAIKVLSGKYEKSFVRKKQSEDIVEAAIQNIKNNPFRNCEQ